ncbi:MAG: alkaline phosphatase D family protein [Nitrospira sp.]|nr:alkaline phosphatase D family protein [Nitrospira sp.]
MRGVALLLFAWMVVWGTPGCVSPSREGLPPSNPFLAPIVLAEDLLPQGMAVGDVSSSSAVIWVRTDGPALVQIEWATPAQWEAVSKMGTARAPVPRTNRLATTSETDYTLSVPIEGLASATRYRYHVWIERRGSTGYEQPTLAATGTFMTLPGPRTSVPVTFVWSADLGGQGHCRQGEAGYPMFDVMRQKAPDFFLFLGDTIYADDACPSPPNEPGADFKAATLAEYRVRHRYQRGAAALRRFLEAVPVYVTWDDHEVRNNFAGPFDERMPVGRQALREYWPIASPPDDPHRLYRSVRYGADLELFLLDTRQYRSRNAEPDGPTKTMLGSAQLKWLLEGISQSTATWKVIATSVPLSVPKGGGETVPGNDGWASGPDGTGFERERQVIVDTILGKRLQNVVFLAGDIHWAQANAYDPDRDGVVDFHEFVAGPLSANPGRVTEAEGSLNPTRLFNESGYHNFGLVRVTKTLFEVVIIDQTGATRFVHRVTAR